MTEKDRTYRIVGQVRGQDGAAVARAIVVATLTGAGDEQVFDTATSDERGHFAVNLAVPSSWPAPPNEVWDVRFFANHPETNRVAWSSTLVPTDVRTVPPQAPMLLQAMQATGGAAASSGGDSAVRIDEAILDFAAPVGGAPLGGGAVGVDEAIDAEFQRLLGRPLDITDATTTSAVFDQLRRNFRQVPTEDESIEYEFVSALPSASSQPEIDTPMTGEQAVLVQRARAGIQNARQWLETLEPAIANFDPKEATAARVVATALLDDLVDQLGYQIPPNEPRVTDAFHHLDRQLNHIARIYGFSDPSRIDLLEKAEDLTQFQLVRDYVRGLERAWQDFLSTRARPSLGTRVVLVQRALAAVADAVADVYRRLDSLGLTVGLRQTLSIEFPQGSGFEPMLAQDVLGWAESWVPGARRVVRSAGAQGLAVVQPTADTLRRIVEAARDGSLPHQAWDRPQIKRALDDLARALQQVAEFAQTNVGGQSYGSGNALEAGLRGTSGRTARSTGATVV